MAGRENGYGGIGRNGRNGREAGDGQGVDELDALNDEELELLVGGVEDEEALLTLEADAAEAADDSAKPTPDGDEDARLRWRGREEARELVGQRLFPDWEYEPVSSASIEGDDRGAEHPSNGAGERDPGCGDGARTGIARARQLLAPVEEALRAEGFYAYGTLDDQSRWTVAVDDEAGRVDVRLGPDCFEIDLRATSPGLYADVEHPFRRRRMERIVRETLPRIARGYLAPHQSTEWDEVDQGVAVCIRYLVPIARAGEIGRIVRRHLPELDDLLALVEERVTS